MVDLIRHRPKSGLSLFSDFDRLFDDMLGSFRLPALANWSLPTADVYSEDDKHMIVEVQAPGYDRDDIELKLDGTVLEIRGERHTEEEQKAKKRSYVVRETTASFNRRVVLPEGADSEHIEAELDKGVLRITVPVERPEAKRIEIAAPRSKAKKLAATTEDK